MFHISSTYTEGVYYYKLFYFAAILIGGAGAALAARRKQFAFREFAFIFTSGIICLIIGSKLSVFNNAQWQTLFYDHHIPAETGKSILGAITGGLIGACIAGWLCGRKDSVMDLFAVSFPLGMAVQRFGCLFAGCCYGSVTHLPWGITYGSGSQPYAMHQHLGFISEFDSASLPVHPDQVYHIIACSLIALIAWRTGARRKSPGGKFIFSIILYLGFRFAEEFTRFSAEPVMWMGLKAVQWKVLIAFIGLTYLFLYRERKYENLTGAFEKTAIANPFTGTITAVASLFILFITLRYAFWFTGDERMIILLTVFPLCGFIIAEIIVRNLLSKKYRTSVSLLSFALIIMAQKSETKTDTPESYTAYNFSAVTGMFNLDHYYNYRIVTVNYPAGTGSACGGGPYPAGSYSYAANDKIPFRHIYFAGGPGISRKKFYNRWQSTLVSVNLLGGLESEKRLPLYNLTDSVSVPTYSKPLFAAIPFLQYDGRGIGLGIGISFGILGYDLSDDFSDKKSYEPKQNMRIINGIGRVRFFSERYFFIEGSTGYDFATVGDYRYWKIMYGSRFDTDKYMLKLGFARKDDEVDLVMEGPVFLANGFYIFPQLMINRDVLHHAGQDQFQAGFTLQYRRYDKKKEIGDKKSPGPTETTNQ